MLRSVEVGCSIVREALRCKVALLVTLSLAFAPRAFAQEDASRVAAPSAVLDGGVSAVSSADAGRLVTGAPEADHSAIDGGVATTEPDGSDHADEEGSIADVSAQANAAFRTVLALLAMLALAYLAGHPRVQRIEEMLGLSEVIAAGFPFFALGALAHLPQINLLTDEALADLGPVLELGLGFIGLLAGQQFDMRAVDRWPKGIGNLTAMLTAVPFAFIALAIGTAIVVLGVPITTSRLMRDAVMFGAAGCLAAPTASALLAGTGLSQRAVQRIRSVAALDDVAGIVLLTFLSAFYRPTTSLVTWSLPGIGWLFVTLGMGLALGLLTYAALRIARTPGEMMALLLGSVALSAGGASFFSVSPIVICFVSGVLLANLPGQFGATLVPLLARIERPTYLLFLLVAGALWRFDMWQGWLLLPVFVAARLFGRFIAAHTAYRRGMLASLAGEEPRVLRAFVSAPTGALSIAIVVNLQTLYPGHAVPLMITAVVGGAFVSEILVQLSHRIRRPDPSESELVPESHDEIDEGTSS